MGRRKIGVKEETLGPGAAPLKAGVKLKCLDFALITVRGYEFLFRVIGSYGSRSRACF